MLPPPRDRKTRRVRIVVGGGEKSPHSDPGSEIRLGTETKKKCEILYGVSVGGKYVCCKMLWRHTEEA